MCIMLPAALMHKCLSSEVYVFWTRKSKFKANADSQQIFKNISIFSHFCLSELLKHSFIHFNCTIPKVEEISPPVNF